MRADQALAETSWGPAAAHDDETPRYAAPLDEQLRIALRKVPASVAIVATGGGAVALGVTATAVTSVSLAPPMLLACVNHALRLNAAIRANGRFRIIYLRREQEEIARAFGGGAAGGERFRVGDWTLSTPNGADLPSALISFFLPSRECCRLRHTQHFHRPSRRRALVRRSAASPLRRPLWRPARSRRGSGAMTAHRLRSILTGAAAAA